jgi:hypothetical protein
MFLYAKTMSYDLKKIPKSIAKLEIASRFTISQKNMMCDF